MELIRNTKQNIKFWKIFDFSKMFKNFTGKSPNSRKHFGIFDVFVKEIVSFNIGFGFVVLRSIW